MEPNDDVVRVHREYAVRRKRQLLATIPVLAILVLFFLVADRDAVEAPFGLTKETATFSMVAVIVVVFGFSLWNWRCPACRRYLGKTWNPRFCHGCGAELRP